MIKIKLTIYIVLLSLSFSFAQQADEIVGKYHLPNELDIQIFKHKDKYYGRIIALNGYEDGQTVDSNNPDKSKHKDKLVGKIIITGLEYDKEENEWINGSMYGPEKGMNFNLKITEIHPKKIEVVGSKYLFWHTLVWDKI